jgi:hypothetical protein
MVFMLSYANNGFVAFIVEYGAADRRDREQCTMHNNPGHVPTQAFPLVDFSYIENRARIHRPLLGLFGKG